MEKNCQESVCDSLTSKPWTSATKTFRNAAYRLGPLYPTIVPVDKFPTPKWSSAFTAEGFKA